MPVLSPSQTIAVSATDLIKSACRLVGALRSGLNLSNAELNDCKLVLNSMLDALSIERVMVPAVSRITVDQNQNTLSLIANQQNYSLGNVNENENFLLARPTRVERVSIMYSASQQTPIEEPMEMIDSVGWQGVSNKTSPSLFPQVCYVDDSTDVFPDMMLWFWPIPTQANPVVLYLWLLLQQFADLTAPFLFPPGYAEMLRFQLAIRLAAEFPCDLQKFAIVKGLAAESKDRVMNLNAKSLEAVCDEAIVGSDGKMGNIYTGTANRSLRY